MRFIFSLVFVSGVLSCLTGNPDTSGQQLTGVQIFKNGKLCKHTGGDEDCNSRLVSTQSGPDSTCRDSPSLHYWPLGPTSDCHGWQATDPFGKLHDNSAANIRCSADGKSLLYTQYAGSLDCTAKFFGGVDKSFTLNECHQGIPVRLYDRARDLSCCGADVDTDNSNAAETETPKSPASTTVTVTTYMDAECLTTPSFRNSTFTMDTTAACNVLPDSSTSNLKCYKNYITYTNHPNSNDCSSFPRENTLEVGKCVQFPGPVATWKKIHAPYNCGGSDDGEKPKEDKNAYCYLYKSYCSSKTKWMLDNCQKTCDYSDDSKPIANPPKEDASPWCYLYTNWCSYQSQWMVDNCQRTCHYGDASAMKQDKSQYCYLYTWLYCSVKSDWMAENCQKSCGY